MNCAASPVASVRQEYGLKYYAQGAFIINPIVGIKTLVLCGNQGINQMFGEVLVTNIGPVLIIILPQQYLFVGVYFG